MYPMGFICWPKMASRFASGILSESHSGMSPGRERELARADDVGAARAPDIVPVDDEGLQHDSERKSGRLRRTRRVAAGSDSPSRTRRLRKRCRRSRSVPESARGRSSRRTGCKKRCNPIRQHVDPWLVDLRSELMQGGPCYRREREECRRAEIHVAGITAENVPAVASTMNCSTT